MLMDNYANCYDKYSGIVNGDITILNQVLDMTIWDTTYFFYIISHFLTLIDCFALYWHNPHSHTVMKPLPMLLIWFILFADILVWSLQMHHGLFINRQCYWFSKVAINQFSDYHSILNIYFYVYLKRGIQLQLSLSRWTFATIY